MDLKTKERVEKLLRLTASDNDHEALLALRTVQKILGNDLTSLLHGGHSADGPRIKALQQKLNALSEVLRQSDADTDQLRYECQRLREQNKKLKKSTKNLAEIKRLKLQLSELKEHTEQLQQQSQDQELLVKKAISSKEAKRLKLFEQLQQFIQDEGISIDKQAWLSTEDLLQAAKPYLAKNSSVSIRGFSMAFSKLMGISSIKGGVNKDRMGFSVKISDINGGW